MAFPNVLDITPFMSKESDDSPRYELYGVVVHIDMLNSSFFGHYICYVKDLHGFWYKIDDSTVNKLLALEIVILYLKSPSTYVFCASKHTHEII